MEKNLDVVSLPDSEEADAHAMQPHMEKQTFHREGISLPVDNLTGIPPVDTTCSLQRRLLYPYRILWPGTCMTEDGNVTKLTLKRVIA